MKSNTAGLGTQHQRMRQAIAVTSTLLLAGCTGAQSALEIRGPAAQRIADIWWPMLAAGVVIYLVVAALVLYLLLRCRPAEAITAHPEPNRAASIRRAKRWILLGGIALPAVVLAPLFLASVRTLSALIHETGSDLTIHVTGRQSWWQVRYKGAGSASDVLAANEIHIPVGRRVRIELATADVIHSLWIPNLHGKADLVPGRTNVMWLEADRPGTSRAQCAEYCGLQHARMALPVIAERQAAFDAWLARERLPRPPPAPLDSAACAGARESSLYLFLAYSLIVVLTHLALVGAAAVWAWRAPTDERGLAPAKNGALVGYFAVACRVVTVAVFYVLPLML